ncbi:MFS transporter [Xanthobacter sp. DSM 24535]|uniref:MFS transporter n=1 Tax=Roseixanthobacter psychrophilus TaxID=3119917 RepID=UPI0037268D48
MNVQNGAQSHPAADEERIGLFPLLAETISVQALGTMAVLMVPALAPAIARDLGVPTASVGYQISLVYFAAMLASLIAGTLVAWYGPCRTGQVAMVLHASGCILASIATLPTMALGAFVTGLGYGLINPAASDLLMRHSPANRRNLIFSVKQTGVPLGGMAAGLFGPQIALAFSWHAALLCVAVPCLLVAGLSQLGRVKLDRHRNRAGSSRLLSFTAIRLVLSDPRLRWLALTSFCFSAVQLCVITFLVALLVEDLGFSLVQAGAILAAVQVSGAVGRVLWGQIADMARDGLAVLIFLAVLMGGASVLIMIATPGWPMAAIVGLLLLLGLSAVGWNGVYLSEVARNSPARAVGTTTGAAMFFTFTGVVFGPVIFSQIHDRVGTYMGAYGLLLALSAAGGLMILTARLRGAR